MTTIPEYQAAVEKDVVNMDRYNTFINGPTGGKVTTDQGQFDNLPTLAAKVQAVIYGAAPLTLVNNNVNDLFADVPALADGASFDGYIMSTNTALPVIDAGGHRYRVTNGGVDLGAGALPAGKIGSFTVSVGGASFILTALRDAVPADDGGSDGSEAVANAVTNGRAARQVLEGLFNVKVGMPFNGDPNRIICQDGPPLADGSQFDVLIAATNTGATTMFYSATDDSIIDRAITVNAGSGAPSTGGEFVSGQIATFEVSNGGGVFVWRGSRDIDFGDGGGSDPVVNPIGAQDADLSFNPWSAITKNALVIGSSNAAVGYVADGSLPSQMIEAALDSEHPGSIDFAVENQAVAGSPWAASGGQLDASTAFVAGNVKWVFPFFWMNDARSVFYHDYGGVGAVIGAISGTIDYIRSKGAEPVLVTGFHPDPRATPQSSASTKALDPFYFSDNPGQSSAYSPSKAAPVSPTADMRPAATDADFMVLRDWSGSGVLRTGYKRVWHINRIIRVLAAQKGCVLLDLEKSTYRYCIETVADKSVGLDTFYANGNPLHPLAPMYQLGIKPVIQAWAKAVIEGRNDIRVFSV